MRGCVCVYVCVHAPLGLSVKSEAVTSDHRCLFDGCLPDHYSDQTTAKVSPEVKAVIQTDHRPYSGVCEHGVKMIAISQLCSTESLWQDLVSIQV